MTGFSRVDGLGAGLKEVEANAGPGVERVKPGFTLGTVS